MQFRYYIYYHHEDVQHQIDRVTFDKMLFNETIMSVAKRTINLNNELLVYDMLGYNPYDNTVNRFYLVMDGIR